VLVVHLKTTMARVSLNFELHDSQLNVYNNRRRFNVVNCGRRWGKTVLAEAVLGANITTGDPAAYFAPTYKMLMDVWRTIKRDFADVIDDTNESEKRITYINGGQLDFWSLDNYDAVRGRKYRRIVIDEAAMVTNLEEAWTMAIRPTLADFKGDAWFFSTPKGRNYFHTLSERARTDETWSYFQLPTSANPHIDETEIDAAQRELPNIVFQQEFLAEFIDVQGALVKREHLTHMSSDRVPKTLRIGMGVDLAISKSETADFTAIAVVGYDPDSGRRYVLDVWRGKVGFHDVVTTIRQYAEKWKPQRINIEAVQYQVAVVQDLLRKTSLPVKAIKPDRDKVTRFHGLLARYEQLLVTHVTNLDPEFERELLSFPIGAHDDIVDALVYAELAAVKNQGAGVVFT
jgi:predicted phage terminase large subunit-like protein